MIYFQSKRIPVLWFATLVSVSCSIFTCYMVFTMPIENDLKDYSSLLTMRIWQVLFILLGNALTVSLCWLSNRYVLLIELTNEHQIKIKHGQYSGFLLHTYWVSPFFYIAGLQLMKAEPSFRVNLL